MSVKPLRDCLICKADCPQKQWTDELIRCNIYLPDDVCVKKQKKENRKNDKE